MDSTRITSTKTDIDEKSIQELYAERAVSRAGVDGCGGTVEV